MRSKQWIAGLMVGLLIGGAAALGTSAVAKKQEPAAGTPVGDLGKEAVMAYRIDTDAFGGNHTTWIEVDSFSWGVTQTGDAGGGGGGGAGKAAFSDLHITKHMDKYSPKIALDVAEGRHLKDLTLQGFASNGKNETIYFKVKLSDILVSSYQVGGESGGSDLPMESISFSFARIDYDFLNGDGSVASSMSCDLAKGTCGA